MKNCTSYEEFVTEYERLVTRLNEYTPRQAGAYAVSSDLADLVEKYPDYEARYDLESWHKVK